MTKMSCWNTRSFSVRLQEDMIAVEHNMESTIGIFGACSFVLVLLFFFVLLIWNNLGRAWAHFLLEKIFLHSQSIAIHR